MQLQNPNIGDEAPQSPAENAAEETRPPVSEHESETLATAVDSEDAANPAESQDVQPGVPVNEETDAPDTSVSASSSDSDNDDAPSAGESSDADGEDEAGSAEEEVSPLGIKRGELIEGVIVNTTPTQIMVEIKEGVVGIVTSRELEQLDRSTLEGLQVGEKLLVYVLRTNSQEGHPILSINRAREEADWLEAKKDADEKNVFRGRVAGYNKGGLIVRYGCLRGFVPASQISPEREGRGAGENPDERWANMLNEEILVKVVEVNRARNRLILSERAADRERRETRKERLISELREGEIRKGRVISLTDFGAFVDLGGADGLIHLTELSWKHVNHPKEILNVGDEVEVKVISIDPQRKRIGLSRKVLEMDPWREVLEGYKVGQLVQGRITKITRFGAFASLTDNNEVEGLIHVSELADYRVEHPRDVVAVGDVLTLRVVKIDPERRRLGLSLKRVDSPRYMEFDWSSWNPE